MRESSSRMQAEDEELRLLKRARLGERDAFADLIRLHQEKIRGLCYGFLLDSSAADDAAQEVFLKAFRKLSSFREEAQFSTWLYSIAVNQCRDMLRTRKRMRYRFLSYFSDEKGEKPRRELSVEDAATAVASKDALLTLLAELPAQYREVLILKEGQGMSYEEMAKVLNCSLDAVRGRLKRARAEVSTLSDRHFSEDFTVESPKEKR